MKAIQIFLIGAMLLAGALAFFRIRTNVFFKPVLMLLLVVGIFFVLFPEITTIIANKVGVDRGADMIFYVYIVTSLIIFIHFYGKLRNLQTKVTNLLREQALAGATKLGSQKEEEPTSR